jgi:transcription initiation factor TFIID subunit TAF12
LAPSRKYKDGFIDVHFRVPTSKYNAFIDIIAAEEKTQTEDLTEYVIHRVEQKRIEQNPVSQKPVSEAISCLGYTPKPVQQQLPVHQPQQQKQQQVQQQQQQLQQSDLRMWLTPMMADAIQMAKKQPLDAIEWTHLARTVATIARMKREGSL